MPSFRASIVLKLSGNTKTYSYVSIAFKIDAMSHNQAKANED